MNIFALWGAIEINRRQAETDIKAVEKQAEKSGKEMESSFNRVTKVVGVAIKEVDKYGKMITDVGKEVTKKAGVPLVGLIALVGGLTKATADYGDQMAKNAQEVGLNVEAYQELTYAMGQNNLSQEDSLRVLGRLNQRVGLARAGNENYRKSLKQMGVSLEDLDKGLVGTEEAFEHILQYLSEMPDSQMQAAYASEIFGTQLSRRMLPLIRSGSEGLSELRDRAHELGIVMDEEAARKSELFGDTMSDLKGTMAGFNRSIGQEALAPVINLATWFTNIVANGTEWVRENPKLVRQIIMFGGAIAGILGVLFTLGTTLVITGKIIGFLGTIFNILISKPMLVIAAIGLLYLAWESDWLGIKTATETAVSAILALWDSLVDWWENNPLVQSIKEAWAEVVEVWEGLTLPEKALGVVAVAATITWALTFLQSFLTALLPKAGITAASGALAGGAKFLFTLGALVVTAKIIWDLLPESLQGDVKDLWTKVGEEIEKFNTETLNNPFIAGIATWLQNLDEEGWTVPTLTVTVLFMAFKLFQKGLILAAALGKAIGTALGATAIPLLGVSVALGAITWLFAKDEEREKLLKKIEEIWGDEELSTVVKLGQITVEVAKWVFPNIVEVLDEHIFAPIRQILGMEKTREGELMQEYLLSDAENRKAIVKELRESTKDAGAEFVKPPSWWEKALGWLGIVKEAPPEISRVTEELVKLEKQALIIAEVMKQGGTFEQAMAILGIAYWETRGHGGFTHTDPKTGEVVRGGAGEYGIGQVMPGTGKDVWTRLWKQPAETFDESMLEDLDTNIAMMVSYFLDRYRVHGEDLRLAIEGYNRGTAIDGMQAYTVGVVDWMTGSDGQKIQDVMYEGLTDALESWIQAGYDAEGDVRLMASHIAQVLADYLVGQSPPPLGPLSVIDEGGANVMGAWIEGAEDGLKDGVPTLTKMLNGIKGLFASVWDKVPDEVKGPIEQAMGWMGTMIEQAEDALWKLEELQDDLDGVFGLGGSPENEAKGFMERLRAGLEEKLDALDDPLNRLVDAVSASAGSLMGVVKAITSGSWLDAFLTILMETESFAKAMELLGAVLAPVVALFDLVLKPIINGILKLWNGIIDALVSISIFGWKPFKDLKDKKIGLVGESDKGGGDDKGRGGRQVSEITGPTRDLLVDLLTPLANFGAIVAPIQDIRNILYDRLPTLDNMAFAGAGASGVGGIVFESGAIVIHSPATNSAELSRNLLDQIEREMAKRIGLGIRGRGGR